MYAWLGLGALWRCSRAINYYDYLNLEEEEKANESIQKVGYSDHKIRIIYFIEKVFSALMAM